jgi:hypothetical protein
MGHVLRQCLTEAAGRSQELRVEPVELYEGDDPFEYLVVVGRKEDR